MQMMTTTDLTEDYDAVVEDLDDECSVFFSVDAPGQGFLALSEEELDTLAEAAEAAYEEEYDERSFESRLGISRHEFRNHLPNANKLKKM